MISKICQQKLGADLILYMCLYMISHIALRSLIRCRKKLLEPKSFSAAGKSET
jgi:hypothetical protein